MLLRLPSICRVGVALAAAAVLAPAVTYADDASNPPGQSTFISPDNHVAFAFTVPQTEDNQYPVATFFSIRVPSKYSWGAVGLGSDDMKGALYLMIYQSEGGHNVTFSPRLAYGNNEPSYWDEMEYTVIANNTGIFDEYMYFTAMCTAHCRSWPGAGSNGGWLDVSSPNQKAIFAVGPVETLQSNDKNAPLRFHREYGVFSIDMARTRGANDAPVLNKDSQLEGTKLEWHETGKSDYLSVLHATFMVFFVVGMMNFGVFVLRACGRVKWHAVNQIVATLGTLSGLALGILTSFHYNRSRSFRDTHQILGYIIVAVILGQLGLGVKHVLESRQPQAPTIFGRVHSWMGRLILFLAVLNSFIGFAFAQKKGYAIGLAFLLLLGCAGVLFFVFGRKRLSRKRQKFQPVGAQHPPPWRETGYDSAYASDAPPGYEPTSQQIDLQTARASSNNSPWRSSAEHKDSEDEAHLGSAPKPREFA